MGMAREKHCYPRHTLHEITRAVPNALTSSCRAGRNASPLSELRWSNSVPLPL